jgi:predicted metal-dependent HD superfamily phosphohydrolase
MNDLRSRWHAITQSCSPNVETELIDEVFDDLDSRYREPHRFYHTWDHISKCLDLLDEHRETASNPDAVELALWYHDSVYVPGNQNNESESARLLAYFRSRLSISDPLYFAADELIRCTDYASWSTRPVYEVRHASTQDESLTQDIDLSILGSDPDEYDRYVANIRREYQRVDPEHFKRGRRAVLSGFLDVSRIYSTSSFCTHYEEKARDNLQRELDSL